MKCPLCRGGLGRRCMRGDTHAQLSEGRRGADDENPRSNFASDGEEDYVGRVAHPFATLRKGGVLSLSTVYRDTKKHLVRWGGSTRCTHAKNARMRHPNFTCAKRLSYPPIPELYLVRRVRRRHGFGGVCWGG